MSTPNLQATTALRSDLGARLERRRQVRHPLRGLATVRLRGPALSSSPTKVVDLSEDGIGVETGTVLQLERTLGLDLEFDGEHLRLIGQVAWSEASGRAGVRFFSLDQKALQQIQQWLFLNAVARATEDGRFAELFPQGANRSNGSIGGSISDAVSGAPDRETAQSSQRHNAGLFRDEEVGEEEESEPLLSPLVREANAMVGRALALTGAKGAALALFEGSQLVCRATCGTDTPGLGSTISVHTGLTGECIRTASVMYCRDTQSDPRVDRDVCADLGIRSLLALPLFAGERVVGLLEVLSQRPGAFDPGDAKVLDMLARPVIGSLFAEVPSGALRKSVPQPDRDDQHGSDLHGNDRREDDREARFQLSRRDVLDLEELDRQRRKYTRGVGVRGLPIHLRAVLAVAVVAVVVPVTWLVVTQGKTLWSLGHTPAASGYQVGVSVPGSASVTPVANNLPRPEADLAKEANTDSAASIEALRQAARQGDVQSQFKMGAKYAGGEGVAQDHTKAAYWFQRAAMSGFAPAQGILGSYYWVGRGVPKDLKQAYFWSAVARSGNDEISKQRVDVLAARMSRADLLEVQQRLREWNRSHPATAAAPIAPTAR